MDSASVLRFHEEVRPYLKMLSDASRTIIDQDVSLYPIFIFHKMDMGLGLEIANAESVNGDWSVNASTLEEFVAKRLIEDARIDSFKDTFKDPDDFFCLFVITDEQSAQFIFVPQELIGSN